MFPLLQPFATGHGPTGNPRAGVVLSLVIALAACSDSNDTPTGPGGEGTPGSGTVSLSVAVAPSAAPSFAAGGGILFDIIQNDGTSELVIQRVAMVLREIELECLPRAIPESVSVDVSALEIGDSIHVRDLELPEGASVRTDGHLAVASVIAPAVVEEPVAEEPEEGEEVAAEGEEAAEAPAEAAETEESGS